MIPQRDISRIANALFQAGAGAASPKLSSSATIAWRGS